VLQDVLNAPNHLQIVLLVNQVNISMPALVVTPALHLSIKISDLASVLNVLLIAILAVEETKTSVLHVIVEEDSAW
jgi:hypothetical protein